MENNFDDPIDQTKGYMFSKSYLKGSSNKPNNSVVINHKY